MKARGRSSPTSTAVTISGCMIAKRNSSPCSQTSSGGPLQRIVLNSPFLFISILRSGFNEVYVTHIAVSVQALVSEHRFPRLSVITGIGSMQRSIFVVELSDDEKHATLPACGVSLVQQVLGWA